MRKLIEASIAVFGFQIDVAVEAKRKSTKT